MAEIARFLGIIISLYVETGVRHHLPHFHVRYNETKPFTGSRLLCSCQARCRCDNNASSKHGPKSINKNCKRPGR